MLAKDEGEKHFVILKSPEPQGQPADRLERRGSKKKRFVPVDELDFPKQTAVQGWLKGYAKEVLVVRQVF